MVAVVVVGVIMDAAGAEIPEMGGNDEHHGHEHHPLMLCRHELLCHQEAKAYSEYHHRYQAVVVPFVPMAQ